MGASGYTFQGYWVAKIVGPDEQYRFARIFLDEITEAGHGKRFRLQSDGFYECCNISATGGQIRHYYRIKNGELFDIERSQLERAFPLAEETIRINVALGSPGDVVKHEGNFWFIVHVEEREFWEDQNGKTHQGRYFSYSHIENRYDWTETTTSLRPATDEEIESYKVDWLIEQLTLHALDKLRDIARSICVRHGAIAYETPQFPDGERIVVEREGLQEKTVLVKQSWPQSRLWSLHYNGGEYDDWSYNNVAGWWVGCWIPIDPELEAELEELLYGLNYCWGLGRSPLI